VTYDRSVVFSTNKTDHHEIIEILLKAALNAIKKKSSVCGGEGVLKKGLVIHNTLKLISKDENVWFCSGSDVKLKGNQQPNNNNIFNCTRRV